MGATFHAPQDVQCNAGALYLLGLRKPRDTQSTRMSQVSAQPRPGHTDGYDSRPSSHHSLMESSLMLDYHDRQRGHWERSTRTYGPAPVHALLARLHTTPTVESMPGASRVKARQCDGHGMEVWGHPQTCRAGTCWRRSQFACRSSPPENSVPLC